MSDPLMFLGTAVGGGMAAKFGELVVQRVLSMSSQAAVDQHIIDDLHATMADIAERLREIQGHIEQLRPQAAIDQMAEAVDAARRARTETHRQALIRAAAKQWDTRVPIGSRKHWWRVLRDTEADVFETAVWLAHESAEFRWIDLQRGYARFAASPQHFGQPHIHEVRNVDLQPLEEGALRSSIEEIERIGLVGRTNRAGSSTYQLLPQLDEFIRYAESDLSTPPDESGHD